MWAAEYLSDAIGRKPVSEGTEFPSAHCVRGFDTTRKEVFVC